VHTQKAKRINTDVNYPVYFSCIIYRSLFARLIATSRAIAGVYVCVCIQIETPMSVVCSVGGLLAKQAHA